MADIGGPFDLFGDFTFKHIRPTEERANIKLEDFTAIRSEAELLQLMGRTRATNKRLRVISSAWSWNRISEADEGNINMIFAGPLSTIFEVNLQAMTARVGGGLMICDFVNECRSKNYNVEWPPKGYCFTPDSSQCFAGFVGTNVHHTYTPTSYDWVNSFRLAVFLGGKPTIVTASRTSHRELFETVFAGVGITGIIVEMEIKLRRPTHYDVQTTQEKYEDLYTAMHRVLEPGMFLAIMPHKQALVARITLPSAVNEPGEDLPNVGVVDPMFTSGFVSTMARFFPPSSSAYWEYLNLSVVETIFGDIIAGAAYEGRGVPYMEAMSLSLSRVPRVTKRAVTSPTFTDGLALDLGFFIPVSQFSEVVDIIVDLDVPPMSMVLRYVPRPETVTNIESGGLLAPNSQEDVICMEIQGLGDIQTRLQPWGTSRLHAWKNEQLWPSLYSAGFRFMPHLGKNVEHHPLFKEALPTEVRKQLSKVRDQYDPAGVFDGGVLQFGASDEEPEGLFVLRGSREELAVREALGVRLKARGASGCCERISMGCTNASTLLRSMIPRSIADEALSQSSQSDSE